MSNDKKTTGYSYCRFDIDKKAGSYIEVEQDGEGAPLQVRGFPDMLVIRPLVGNVVEIALDRR